MKITRNVKCIDCGDIFRIEYDSRKNRQDSYTCKCGKLRVYPDSFGGFSYHRDGNYAKMSYEDRKGEDTFYEEDYIRLTEEQKALLTEYDRIGEQLNKKSFHMYENSTNDNNLDLCIGGSDAHDQTIDIRIYIRLFDREGWKYDREKQEQHIQEAVQNFGEILQKIQSGEIDIEKPKEIWENNSLEHLWTDGNKKQHDRYDYTLYC